jgi:hypothetical protein
MGAKKEDFSLVLDTLFNSMTNDDNEFYKVIAEQPRIKEAKELLKRGDWDRFYYQLLYPFSQSIDGLLSQLPRPKGRSLEE